jgi:hypothetical protein
MYYNRRELNTTTTEILKEQRELSRRAMSTKTERTKQEIYSCNEWISKYSCFSNYI